MKNDYRITFHAATPVKPRRITSKTLRNAWGTLSVFWRWVSSEFSIDNPFRVAPVKAYMKPINPLTQEEVEAILKECDALEKHFKDGKIYSSKRPTSLRDKAIIMTLLDTGMRVGELIGIKLGDLNFETGRILVTGKGQKQRFVYLGKVSRQVLWRYVTDRYPRNNPPVDEPLFLHKDGIHALTNSGILLLVRRMGKKASVANVHPHRFRHTFAIQFLRNGGNIFELQHILGHEDLSMVKNYVQLAQLDIELASRKASPADNWRLR